MEEYDVVIVGAGIAGALMAYELGSKGKKVLILEAGIPTVPVVAKQSPVKQDYINRFYTKAIKTPGAPFPNSKYAPKQISPGVNESHDGFVNYNDPKENYWIQTGASAFSSMYERSGGGTTQHWLGTCLRFLPDDFKVVSKYNLENKLPGAIDWPIGYDDLEPWYTQAEYEIGVSGDASVDESLGAYHSKPYPMTKIQQSYLDQTIGGRINGKTVGGRELQVVSTPQARNSKEYDSRPACMGNTSCVPICPINAKYDASVHLRKALKTGNVTIQYQSVVYQVVIDGNDAVSGLKYKTWTKDGVVEDKIQAAKRYVLAAHTIETPKILLNSPWKEGKTVANSSDLVGRNLMDHICMLAWGNVMDGNNNYVPVYPYRGPLSTSGIPAFRNDATTRGEYAGWRIEVGNDGWIWPTNAPYSNVTDLVGKGMWGSSLKSKLNEVTTSQFRIALELESISGNDIADSRVSLSEEKDALGIPRPNVNYKLGDYTLNGFVKARDIAKEIFITANISWETSEPQKMTPMGTLNPGYLEFTDSEGSKQKIVYQGAGHLIGTHRMGDSSSNSVVDKHLRSWDHKNLFLVGCGAFPTTGTANPTLTLAALSLRAAATIEAEV